MKARRDMRGPKFMPTDNLHTTRSNPASKASSTVYLYPEGVNGSDLSFRRPAFEASHTHSEEYIRNLSRRLESGSNTPVPELAPKIMGRRRSDTISPLSHDSINDLIQSRPDSPVEGHIPGVMQADFKWKTSKKILHIDVSESSQDTPLDTFLPLSQSTNAASTPPIQTVTSNHPVIVVPKTSLYTYDGPASVANVTKDFSHSPADCPIISEAKESQDDTAPINATPRHMLSTGRVPLSALDNVPTVNGNSLKHGIQAFAKPLNPAELPTIPAMSGLPFDATGLAPIPATPKSNLNKNQKFKVKLQKSIRKSRRVVMRKSVLSVLLGRQVAGATLASLKIVSKGGSIVADAMQGAVPAPVPMPR